LGRVSAQKDPRFFLEVRSRVERMGVSAQWQWIGGGNPKLESVLAAAGVRVTGWLAHDAAMRELAACTLYVHTAAWESAPMSLQEVAFAGKAMLVRSLPALVSLGFEAGIESPEDMARAIVDFVQKGHVPAAPATPGPNDQEDALQAAYSLATSNRQATVRSGVDAA
jgi:hypothetical protein